ncbi:MAG: hypothetical protein IT442_12515 [Phycisphaeraceae bacterium]|nr:hypothetical protein [Phycisphaeraceae bacterium]
MTAIELASLITILSVIVVAFRMSGTKRMPMGEIGMVIYCPITNVMHAFMAMVLIISTWHWIFDMCVAFGGYSSNNARFSEFKHNILLSTIRQIFMCVIYYIIVRRFFVGTDTKTSLGGENGKSGVTH